MKKEIDWDNAPKNAVAWIEDLNPSLGGDYSCFYYSECDNWLKKSEARGRIKVHYRQKSQKKPELRGPEDGLPPIRFEFLAI